MNKGDVFGEDNLTIKRPGIGIKPKHLEAILGKEANNDIEPEELLKWDDIVNTKE